MKKERIMTEEEVRQAKCTSTATLWLMTNSLACL